MVLALLAASAILGALLLYIKLPYPLACTLLTPVLVLLLMLAIRILGCYGADGRFK